MHSKFTSDNGLETIAKKSSNLYHKIEKDNYEPANNKKLTTGQRKTLRTRDLDELVPEPAIRSCDSGQRIPYFYSCQLTII